MTTTLLVSGRALAFDHAYTEYSALLTRHVQWTAQGHASAVDYAGLKRESAPRLAVEKSFSSVGAPEFDTWSREQQMAFLINAYNFFTLQLVLTKYPDISSIKDLGSLLRSAWKIEFFDLLGARRYLDWIEHEQLRPRYREPRVHFAVNCASIGCPALRPEAYVADRLDAQLDDQTRRFLSDRTRNRYHAAERVLYLSPIFKWYGEDFAPGGKTLPDWLKGYDTLLADAEADRRTLRSGSYRIDYLSYDWALNARSRSASGLTR